MKYWILKMGNKIPTVFSPIHQDAVCQDILNERIRQDGIWGDQVHNSNERWNVIAVEEVGEVARAIYDDDPLNLYKEIIQTAAVYVAWAESIRRWSVYYSDHKLGSTKELPQEGT